MSRSYKTGYGCFRKTRGGYRNILRHKKCNREEDPGVRNKAIPPDPWDDLPLDDHNRIPSKVALALHKKGWSDDKIANHIRRKFGMPQWKIELEILPGKDWAWWWGCKCDRCEDARNHRAEPRLYSLEEVFGEV